MSRFQLQRHVRAWGVGAFIAVTMLVGCGPSVSSPKVIFLDGAGHVGADFFVRRGLLRGGYVGDFERFRWSSWLGPGADHLVVARSSGKALSLANKIRRSRQAFPNGKIHLISLSAGSAVVLAALEELPDDVQVDTVVLLSPSVSSRRDLTPALEHIKGRLYATCSEHDAINAALPITADGGEGPPAGYRGFFRPFKRDAAALEPYAKVVNLPWRPRYLGLGWRGNHVGVTSSRFIECVIAPRIRCNGAYPLDRPLFEPPAASVASSRTKTHRTSPPSKPPLTRSSPSSRMTNQGASP